MKNNIIYWVLTLLLVTTTSVHAQFVTKSGQKENNNAITTVSGSEEEDITAFRIQVKQLESAYLSNNKAGVNTARQAIESLAQKEVNRTSATLKDLQSGKLSKDPNTGKEFNVPLEIQVLSNRLSREKYLLNKLKSYNPDNRSSPRDFASIKSNLVEFERLMKANLKYEKKSEPQKSSKNKTGTSSISSAYSKGGNMISASGNTSGATASKGKTHNSDFFLQNEQKQVNALNKAFENRKQKAKTLITDFDSYVKKGNLEKASGAILEASALVNSDIRAKSKFLKRAESFKQIKINKKFLSKIIETEYGIKKDLDGIKIKNLQELHTNSKQFKSALNRFISLDSIIQ